jgi:hypothetical protein
VGASFAHPCFTLSDLKIDIHLTMKNEFLIEKKITIITGFYQRILCKVILLSCPTHNPDDVGQQYHTFIIFHWILQF